MPRLRLRRLFLTLTAIACGSLLLLNFKIRETILSGRTDQTTEVTLRKSNIRALSVASTTSVFPGIEELEETQPTLSNMEKYWFMKDGMVRPMVIPNVSPKDLPHPRIWPHEEDGDRITNQLMYIPPGYEQADNTSKPLKLKKILLYFGRGGWHDLPMGRTVFQRDKCPVDRCELTTSHSQAANVDAIFFKDRFSWPKHKRSPNQVWILFLLECPLHTQRFGNLGGVFNWTATYRHDSDVVAPYEKFVSYYEDSVPLPSNVRKNYAAGKTKKVAWFVSNCAARNHRLQYARELSRHIQVDIYGICGNHRCPRTHARKCFQMLDRDYKFYLAFENSNCKDYITEKFFVNGLGRDVIPIVLGAKPEDYRRSAPYHSYIHVEDFETPKELAEYLMILDKNDTLYNEYFRWKGTGEFINTYFWCRICAMLHAPAQPKVYKDMHAWWSGSGTCTSGSWKKPLEKKPDAG